MPQPASTPSSLAKTHPPTLNAPAARPAEARQELAQGLGLGNLHPARLSTEKKGCVIDESSVVVGVFWWGSVPDMRAAATDSGGHAHTHPRTKW